MQSSQDRLQVVRKVKLVSPRMHSTSLATRPRLGPIGCLRDIAAHVRRYERILDGQ